MLHDRRTTSVLHECTSQPASANGNCNCIQFMQKLPVFPEEERSYEGVYQRCDVPAFACGSLRSCIDYRRNSRHPPGCGVAAVSHDQGRSPDGVLEAVPAPRTSGRRLGRLATFDADINIKLLSRLAETAITSGDVKTAVEAVQACTAGAGNLYQIAVAERRGSGHSCGGRGAHQGHSRAGSRGSAACSCWHHAERGYRAARPGPGHAEGGRPGDGGG